MALLTNANGRVQVDVEVVEPADAQAAVEALTVAPGTEGGRRVKGQLHMIVPVAAQTSGTVARAAATLGTSLGWFTNGVTPVAYSDGTIPAAAFTQGTQGAVIGFVSTDQEVEVRTDFTMTIHDLAFEEFDIFGGPLSAKERTQAAQKF